MREAHRQLERHRWETRIRSRASRSERLLLGAAAAGGRSRRPSARGNRAYEDYRENGRDTHGRRLGRRPKPYRRRRLPEGEVNLTDPDSSVMKANRGYVQGYNAQAAVNEEQIVLAAEITDDAADFSHSTR